MTKMKFIRFNQVTFLKAFCAAVVVAAATSPSNACFSGAEGTAAKLGRELNAYRNSPERNQELDTIRSLYEATLDLFRYYFES